MAHMRRISSHPRELRARTGAARGARPQRSPKSASSARPRPRRSPAVPGTPCLAVSRTTGFQVKVGTVHNPLSARAPARSSPGRSRSASPTRPRSSSSTNTRAASPKPAIAILRAQAKPNLTYKLIAQSPLVKLEPYFGKTAQFPLETTIPVKKGDVVALTVPTWAPALALGFGNATSWRASRPKSQCTSTSAQTTQTHGGQRCSVLLPVPDRAPDVQRNADLHSVGRCGAVAPPVGLAPGGGSPAPAAGVSLAAFSFSSGGGAAGSAGRGRRAGG